MNAIVRTEHAPGIYFGMPAEEYHADPAFSTSGVKDILVSPLTYWVNSALNPDHEPPEESVFMGMGTAFHTRLLEGAEVFTERYAVLPSKDDHPDAIDGGDAIRAKCKDLGVSAGGTIAAMCERILEKEPDALLWPVILAEFKAANEGKELIGADLARRIDTSARIVECHPSARKALGGGYPEVSIFWVDPETGIRMKCRVDYLKARAGIDLKTFTNPNRLQVDEAVARKVANERYHIQGVIYCEGLEAVKDVVRADPSAVHGEVDPTWLAAFLDCPEHVFVFVFLESGRVQNLRVRQFMREGGRGEHGQTLYWEKGMMAYRRGLDLYAGHMAKHGPDRPWYSDDPMRPFEDDEFPIWM
jgi:hypothetical protein